MDMNHRRVFFLLESKKCALESSVYWMMQCMQESRAQSSYPIMLGRVSLAVSSRFLIGFEIGRDELAKEKLAEGEGHIQKP
mmetsp:Transcript_13120/g.31918  ORF Transcript_13120/g.31918 Transcript_13120/m.31918 type:complete len:81 (+) Transcript_13120:1278-1520(+)